MKTILVSAVAVLLVGLAHPIGAEPPGKDLAALEKKLLGTWKGQGGCDGRLVFRADGTYELTEYGPGADDSAGTWKVRWDALPPTLVLICRTSEVPENVCKITEVKLIKLDDKNLVIEYSNPNGSPSGHYARVKK